MTTRCLALLAALAPAAFGQFTLYQVDGNVEHPAPAVFDVGSVYPNETASARFRLRNTSASPAALSLLAVRGSGFSLSGAPALPFGLASQQAIDFSVLFQAKSVGSYSAALDSEGIAVILTAAVLPGLTYQVDGAPLGPAGANFGTIETGASMARHFTATNLTALPLPVPPVSAGPRGFSVPAPVSSGAILQPLGVTQFDVVFQPAGVGNWTGALTIGDRTYPLTGTAVGPPLPRPALTIELADARSGQQGSIAVNLDAASRTAGAGTLTLDFQPSVKGATDPAIQLGVMGRALPFTIAAGDTQVRFGDLRSVDFQTGTTAGTIVVMVELGGVTDRKTILIPPAAVGIVSAAGTKSSASIDLRVSGFDNTRTAGAIVYTFYDAAGIALPPIPADNTADFARFFAVSDGGGAFLLRSVFPVTGDPSKIAAFEVEFKNSMGSASTGRVSF